MPAMRTYSKNYFLHFSSLDTLKVYGYDKIPSMLFSCLDKHFCLCLSFNTFQSCCQFSLIQPILKTRNFSQPVNKRLVAQQLCLFNMFESTILNCKFLKLHTFRYLPSDFQCGFLKGRTTVNFLFIAILSLALL